MILHEFPDLKWLKRNAELSFSKEKKNNLGKFAKGWPNVILQVNSKGCYRDNIRGPFSLFTNIDGESAVEVHGKRAVIREGFYFITNHDQYYTLDIAPNTPTETFNIHFGEHLMDELWGSLTLKTERLLDQDFDPSERLCFHNRLNIRNETINRLIRNIRSGENDSPLLLEENLVSLAYSLLQTERNLIALHAQLPVIRTSTRREILKRLLVAVDFIYENYHRETNLDEIASVCCLSKFHFLRLFKTMFRKTPAQFIEELRIRKAREALQKKQAEIHQLARTLGYRNASSFSRMFKNHVGIYPTQYRDHADG